MVNYDSAAILNPREYPLRDLGMDVGIEPQCRAVPLHAAGTAVRSLGTPGSRMRYFSRNPWLSRFPVGTSMLRERKA